MPGYQNLRLPDAYRALVRLEARGFAWEWLRRAPGYRAAWAASNASTRRAAMFAETAIRRTARTLSDIPPPSSPRRWSPWGIGFPGRS